MKKTITTCLRLFILSTCKTLIFPVFIFTSFFSYAQNTWTAKQDFGGTVRNMAAGFTIGTKVYIGTGTDAGLNGKKDFWEYNTANNTWTQKTDFGGLARFGAVGFSINGKGYIGLGTGDQGLTVFKDIWEYDPTLNTWTLKTDLTGVGRLAAVAFVVNNKAYVGTGQSGSGGTLQDLWEFDPVGNSWASKANFPGTARYFATGFAIGTKGYLGTGSDVDENSLADFWEYDPTGNAWIQRANVGGGVRFGAVGFAINTRGYIGTGGDTSPLQDLWEYNPTANTWTQKANFTGTARFNAVGVASSTLGYIGTGTDGTDLKNFYEYTPSPVLTDQTISFNALTGKTFGDGTFGLTATASSSLTVSYVSSNTAVATISGSAVTIIGAGTTTITASQAGNGTYNPAPPVDQTLTVSKTNQSITFTALSGKTFGDGTFGLTATASSSLSVSYASSNTAVATVSGSTVTIVGAGSTTITASQAGNENYNPATSIDQTLSVAKANQTITFNTLSGRNVGEAPFGLTASASSGLTIGYASSNTAVATVSGSTVTIVGEGSTTITASQTGNVNYNAAVDVPQGLTVTENRASQTITFGALADKTFGNAAFTLSATVSSSLTVAYASSNTSVAIVSGNTVTIVGAGATTITASQAGDASFKPATSVDQPLTVNKANQTPNFFIPVSITFGQGTGIGPSTSASLPVTVTSSNPAVATVAPGPGNTWFFTPTGVGTTSVTITQAGNANYNPVSLTQDMVVLKGDQTITFSALASKKFGDDPFVLSATASSGLEITYGTSDSYFATVVGNVLTIKNAGIVDITANQVGNTNYNGAVAVVRTLFINKASQSISFAALEDQSTLSAPYTISATASSSLPVSFSSSNTAVATVSGNQITIVGNGSTIITASQGGNGNYTAASADQTLTVRPGQTITFDPLAAKVIGDAPFTISATASSGLPVTFASTNTAVASVNGNTVTINGIGSTAITATQGGDATYVKAANVSRVLVVKNIVQPANEQGQIWGMIADGGQERLGLIFKTGSDGTDYTVVKEFKTDTKGAFPSGTLTLASNGKFYGITYEGGLYNGGVLFEYDPATGTYATKFDFQALAYPVQELTASTDGKLYGMVQQGLLGISGQFIFEFDLASSSITKKLSIPNDVGQAPSGKLKLAANGKMYGLLNQGGVNSKGSVFEYDLAANSIVKKADFAGTDGTYPIEFTLGANGKLYGTTSSGGSSNDGVIFEFDPSTGSITKRFDFTSASSGAQPKGLMTASNGKLYGMTFTGGANGVGTIFEFDPASNLFTKKYDFISVIGDNQGRPYGRLTEAPNGKLYGADAASGVGTLFEFDVATNTFTRKVVLSGATGSPILGSLSLLNNKMYGLANRGGSANAGVLFEYDFTTNNYVNKVEFAYSPEGAKPQGSLTLASNGKLYGVTRQGGATNDGVIFEIDPVTDTYTKRADFNSASTGSDPETTLHLGLNGKLYGAARQGGAGINAGGLFEFDPATFSLQNLSSFNIANGLSMYGKLVQTEDGKLWGLASSGGISFPNSGGVLFEFDPISKTTVKKNDFTPTTGTEPLGGLTLASNGKLYGLTSKGGTNDVGTLFEYDRTTNTFTKKYDFSASSGTTPHATLTEVNAKLYGTTYKGGTNDVGVLFEYDLATGTYTKKYDFNSPTGAYPKGSLLLAANGKLYGTTLYGGVNGWGVVFEYDVTTSVYTVRSNFANLINPFLEITSLTQTFKSFRTDQTITFNEIAVKKMGDPVFTLTATSTSLLAVQFTTTSDKVTIAGTSVTLVKAGSVTINANQSGNSNFNAAPQVQRTFCINPAKPVITITDGNTDNVKLNSSNPTGNQWFLNGTAISNATEATYAVKGVGIYSVQTSIDGCVSEFSSNTPIIITGDLTTLESTNLTFYPNPVDDKLIIAIPGNSRSQINIFQMDGRHISNFSTGELRVEVDVREYKSGVYLVKVTTGKSKEYVGKFIKK